MAIVGIIGTEEADEKIVIDGLIDIRDRAAHTGDPFWAIVGLTPDSPEVVGTIIQWFIDEEVAYDLVVHPEVDSAVPEEFVNGSDKKTKIKAVENKIVDRLIAEDGTHLLLLVGDGNDPSDEMVAVSQKAHDNGIVVMDLADALNEFQFGDPDVETEEEAGDDEIDYDALGEAADDGDDVAMETLTEMATAVDLDPNDYPTWAELAETLKPAEEEPVEEKPAAKKAAAKAQPAAKKGGATLWTEEALDALEPKEVKAIAAASGIEGAGKMALSAVKAALIGKPMPDAEAPEEEPEEEAPKKPAARGKAKAAETKIGKPLEGSPDTGDAELNDILSMFNTAFTRLVNYVSAK